MSIVKFLDLQSQYRSIKSEIDSAVIAVLESSAYVLGPEVEAFEQTFAAAHGARHGIAVNSGTSALHVALLAAGIGAGDEVITVAMTFTATAAAISYTVATPVFVDVDPQSFTMDLTQMIRAALYRQLLSGTDYRVAAEVPDRHHVYHIFSVFHPERDRLQAYLQQVGVQTGLHYPFPVHLQKVYAELGHKKGDFPVSEMVGRDQLSLPIYAELADVDVERVVAALKEFR